MADVKFRTTQVALNTSTGTQDITISAFGTPKAAMFFWNSTLTNGTQAAINRIGFGFTDGTTDRAICNGMRDNVTTTGTSTLFSDALINMRGDTGTPTTITAAFDSWITDGIRIDLTTAPSSAYLVTVVLIGGSDVTNAKVENIGLNNTALTDVTTTGFNPDLLFFGLNGLTAFPSISTGSAAYIGYGMAHNGGNQGMMAYRDRPATSTSDVLVMSRNDAALSETSTSSTNVLWTGTIQDYDADGFSVATTSGRLEQFCYLALKFSGSPDIAINDVDGPTTTGNKSYTDAGFEPDFNLLLASDATSSNVGLEGGLSSMSFYAVDASNEFSVSGSSENGVATTNTNSLQDTDISLLTAGSTLSTQGSFVSFDTLGTTFNFTTAPATARKYAMLSVGPAGAVQTATVSGTATANITEDNVVLGGKTIIVTVTNDTWVAAGAAFDAQRQNIIDGLDSAQSETFGWNNERSNLPVTDVVRTSDTVVTITLSALASYDITAQEVITATVPNTALVASAGDIVGTPTFTIDPVSASFQPFFAVNTGGLI